MTHRRRPLWLLATFVTTAVTLVLMMAQATPANTADTYRIEIVNHFSGLCTDVIWGSTDAYQGVFLWSDNTSAPRSSICSTAGTATSESGPDTQASA